jgi:hypothetical protein
MPQVERPFAHGIGQTPDFEKAGALGANDFAGQARIGSTAKDVTGGKLYICTATNGTTTATWVVVGVQT